MTAPLIGEGIPRAATLRSYWEPSQSLAMSRMKRAIGRQWGLALVIAMLIGGAGVGYDLWGGASPISALLFWSPIAIAAGLAAGLISELSRNTVTSLSSLGKQRGYSVLGAAPELTPRSLRQLPPDQRNPLGCLAFQPAAPYSTAFRDLQSTLSDKGVVAFIAAMSEDGATTAALSTAVSATQQGRNVIVVDCDLRRRSLTRRFDGRPENGVLEAAGDPTTWRSLVVTEDETGVQILPAARIRNPWRSSLVGSRGFAELIGLLRQHYDQVILDCPPALASSEGAVIASMADASVVVAAWDKTPLTAVRRTMQMLKRRMGGSAGIYVNRVPPGYRFGRLRPD